MAIKTDIEFHVGEDKSLVVTVTGTDITGWTIEFAMAQEYGGPALFTKTVGSGIALTTPASGIFTVTISDTDTDGLEAGDYVWDAKRTTAGQEYVVAYGKATLLGRVSSA